MILGVDISAAIQAATAAGSVLGVVIATTIKLEVQNLKLDIVQKLSEIQVSQARHAELQTTIVHRLSAVEVMRDRLIRLQAQHDAIYPDCPTSGD